MKEKKKISFIIPCYRSSQTIENVINEIVMEVDRLQASYEIIAIDDNSPDDLWSVLCSLGKRNSNIKLIKLAKNFGQHAGMMAGVRHATGDICVFLDDDGQCPVDHLSKLIRPLDEGWDISIAEYGKKKQGAFKNFGSFVNEKAANCLIDKPHDIRLSNFMAIKRYIADELKGYNGPYPYISGLLFRSSSKVINVPMSERERMQGRTTYTFRKLFSLWVSSFTAFSIKPLRFATVVGGMSALCGVVFALYVIIHKIIQPYITSGWSSIVAVNMTLGGLILFVLGIAGEYIGRIYMTINGTPQYVISQSVNICDVNQDEDESKA